MSDICECGKDCQNCGCNKKETYIEIFCILCGRKVPGENQDDIAICDRCEDCLDD